MNTTLGDVLESFWGAKIAELRVMLPGRIESFDAATCTATVKPLLQETRTDENGAQIVESLPVLQGVPVIMPGAGGMRITFPVASGDTCMLVFADRGMGQWFARGGDVDPIDRARHALKDAVAVLGLKPSTSSWAVDSASMTIGADSGAQIKIEAGASGAANTPVAKEGSSVIGFAGPFAVSANVAVGAGSPKIKVP